MNPGPCTCQLTTLLQNVICNLSCRKSPHLWSECVQTRIPPTTRLSMYGLVGSNRYSTNPEWVCYTSHEGDAGPSGVTLFVGKVTQYNDSGPQHYTENTERCLYSWYWNGPICYFKSQADDFALAAPKMTNAFYYAGQTLNYAN